MSADPRMPDSELDEYLAECSEAYTRTCKQARTMTRAGRVTLEDAVAIRAQMVEVLTAGYEIDPANAQRLAVDTIPWSPGGGA